MRGHRQIPAVSPSTRTSRVHRANGVARLRSSRRARVRSTSCVLSVGVRAFVMDQARIAVVGVAHA